MIVLESSTVVTVVIACATAALVTVSGLVAMVSLATARRSGGDDRTGHELRSRLAVLSGTLLFAIFVSRLLSWPAVLLCLDGLAPLVSGAMCGYGVLQATPELAVALGVAKVLCLFGLTLSVLLSRFRGGEASGVARAVRAVALLLALADSGVDAAFATAERETVEVSCCTTVLDAKDRLSARVPERILGVDAGEKVLGVNLAVGALALVLLLSLSRVLARGKRPPIALLGGAVGASLASLPLGGLTATEWIAPCVLHLPHHHCPVETWTETPDGGVLLALLLCGSLLPASATLAFGFAGAARSRPAARRLLARVLQGGAWTGAAFLVMALSHLAVAEWLP